ncbi:unnamed protein product [Rotaria sp. Silwood2]|nr:unnamed protein product [Rotaria sp. Silwood2]CAF4470304.1 unnamed protein product [Rotaria sp. Silwood2]
MSLGSCCCSCCAAGPGNGAPDVDEDSSKPDVDDTDEDAFEPDDVDDSGEGLVFFQSRSGLSQPSPPLEQVFADELSSLSDDDFDVLICS